MVDGDGMIWKTRDCYWERFMMSWFKTLWKIFVFIGVTTRVIVGVETIDTRDCKELRFIVRGGCTVIVSGSQVDVQNYTYQFLNL